VSGGADIGAHGIGYARIRAESTRGALLLFRVVRIDRAEVARGAQTYL
jgi:hypothetical protein